MRNGTEQPIEPEVQTHAIELMERAQIDIQISTARKYPRDIARIKQNIISMATMDEETAEQCFFTLKRGDKIISGPSIRLAEIAVSCYGHIRAGARVIDQDSKTITAQGGCHDLQNNVIVTMETKRRITNKEGKLFNEDMQIMTGNAAAAIAFRNAVFKVVPGAFIKPAFDAAKAVAIGTAATLKARRAKAIEKFKAYDVEPDRLIAFVGKTSMEEIGLAELELLIGAFNSIKDSEQTIEEVFGESDGLRQNATIQKKKRDMAAYIAKTEGVSLDEAMKLAEERWETNGQQSARQEKQMDEQAAEQKQKAEQKSEPTVEATGDAATLVSEIKNFTSFEFGEDGKRYAAGMEYAFGKGWKKWESADATQLTEGLTLLKEFNSKP